MQPLLSVIIPTHNRPQYLSRAVESALQAAPNGDVEVIVVPNGGDETWKESLASVLHDARITVSPIAQGHANVARNHGLRLAKGKYIRFLDDDDFFYPEAAREQLIKQIADEMDISYGYIVSVDTSHCILKCHKGVECKDFAVFGVLPFSKPLHGFIYRKDLLDKIVWDESVNKRQDVYWLFDVVSIVELKFDIFNKVVGVWVHHDGERVSKGHSVKLVSKETAQRILVLFNLLNEQTRLNEGRKYAISSRLWRCVHDGLMYEPIYWIKIARIARKISDKGNPMTPIYSKISLKINPLFWEFLLVPFRWLKVLFGHRYSN